MEILNFATGNYTFGVVIPFFPVFYLSENQFELESKNFNIGCRVENFVDFKKPGVCHRLKIIFDGKAYTPIKIEDTGYERVFEFNLLATHVNQLILQLDSYTIGDGETIQLPIKARMKIEDWTRYHLIPVAP
ncbi:MAG: hypothetical protein CME66_06515 [Halobacteriovoraceae bacterium]|nr:hypothetical protein [Halobacteriovoraceae bacterium]